MSTFKDREKAAENKYAHDQETAFRINARRTKLFGLWAAGRMSMAGNAADDYARNLIAATVSANEDEEIIAKVKADLSARGVSIADHDLKEELYRVTQVAKDQILKELPPG